MQARSYYNQKLKLQETLVKELSNKMSIESSKLILDAFDLLKNGKANFTEQDETKSTFAKKIEKFETEIDWKVDAKKIIAKINAFSPIPGCWFRFLGTRIKIIKAKEVENFGEPGIIINDKFTISCSKNAVQILELKKKEKKMLVEEFLRGNKIEIGQKLN